MEYIGIDAGLPGVRRRHAAAPSGRARKPTWRTMATSRSCSSGVSFVGRSRAGVPGQAQVCRSTSNQF
jgi:hypothetical protein